MYMYIYMYMKIDKTKHPPNRPSLSLSLPFSAALTTSLNLWEAEFIISTLAWCNLDISSTNCPFNPVHYKRYVYRYVNVYIYMYEWEAKFIISTLARCNVGQLKGFSSIVIFKHSLY